MILFLDTNVLLHYPQVKDVDWCNVCKSNTVKIVICMQVIDELDAKKNEARFRDRAERIIKEIQSLKGQTVRDGVTLEVFVNDLQNIDFAHGVVPDAGDERIIQHVKNYAKQTHDPNVAVYTDDYGMQLRCTSNGFRVIAPDKSTRLTTPQSEEERRLKELSAELDEIKNARPDLELTFVFGDANGEKGPNEEFEFVKTELELLDIDSLVESDKAKYPYLTNDKSKSINPFDEYFEFSELPNWQIDNYNEELTTYRKEYAALIETTNKRRIANGRVFAIILTLENKGNGPADDVDVQIRLPDIFLMIEAQGSDVVDKLLNPKNPTPPERPGSGFSGLVPSFDETISKHLSKIAPKKADDDAIVQHEKNGTHLIHAHIERVKHRITRRVGTIVAAIKTWELMQPFEAKYGISVANHPKLIEGKLVFKVRLRQ